MTFKSNSVSDACYQRIIKMYNVYHAYLMRFNAGTETDL